MADRRTCQAEDMGGWSACDEPATLGPPSPDHWDQAVYCEKHRTSWRGRDEHKPLEVNDG